MWKVYKKGLVYRVGEEEGRFKDIYWYMNSSVYWTTSDKNIAFGKAKKLNNPEPELSWKLVEE